MFKTKSKYVIAVTAFFIAVLGWSFGFAQIISPDKVLEIHPKIVSQEAAPGVTIDFVLEVEIEKNWHINSHEPLEEFFIATELKFTDSPNFSIEKISYPNHKLAKFSFSEQELAVFEENISIHATLKLADGATPENLVIRGELYYQACNDVACLQPVSKKFEVELPRARQTADPSPEFTIENTGAPNFGQDESANISSEPPNSGVLSVEVKFSLDKAQPGGEVKIALALDVQKGWHINSNKPRDEFLIPTEIVFEKVEGLTFGETVFPKEKMYKFSFSDEEVAVFEGKAIIGVPASLGAEVSGDGLLIKGVVKYQACNEVSCLAPVEISFEKMLPMAALSEAISLVNAEIFESIAFEKTAENADESEIGGLIAEKGFALTFFFIFLGGLALNLTPCVYPLIPITISFFGSQAQNSTAKLFSLAVFYLLGIALTYSALGVVAALSGSIFGAALQSPIVILFVAGVMVLLALSMFGVWELTIPQKLNQMAGGSKKGYMGSFFMGLTVGIVAAPCIGPFVLALLTFVGTTGDPVLGFWMFFTLSLGLGLPYVVLGTFSGSLNKLPRSGMWMIWVKKVFGFVLLAMAAWFLDPILPDAAARFALPSILLIGGVFVAFFDKTQGATAIFPVMKKAVGLAFVIIAAWLAWPSEHSGSENWLDYSPDALAEAREQGKPVIIDFTAEWCIACKELEKYTFPSDPVMQRADDFVLLRADMTKFASPPVEKIKKKFDIKGLPTVVFLDGSGVERKELRVIGFVNGDEFAGRMDSMSPRQTVSHLPESRQ